MSIYPWFEAPTASLRRAMDVQRLAHALLIVIPSGWGRNAFLHELAKTVLELPSVPAQLDAFAHVDFLWVQSYDSEGNPSKVIQVDAVRDLANFAVQRAAVAPRKLAVLPHAHNMTVHAANALLKTLEEPVSDCCIVLESSRPAQLLPTIVSRCQRLPFQFSRQHAMDFLSATGDTAAIDCLNLAGGGPLDALELAQTPDISMRRITQKIAAEGARSDVLDRMARSDHLLDMLDQWYRLTIELIVADQRQRGRERLLAFADELLTVRSQIESVKGVNTRLLLDRLAFLWKGCLVS